MPDPSPQPQPPAAADPELPPGLAGDLRALHAWPAVAVPGAVDAAILEDARRGFWQRHRAWRAIRWAGATAAAAAAVFIVVVAVQRNRGLTNVAATQQQFVPGDVDRSGRVDMVDALALARRLDAGASAPSAGEDANGDGVLDRRDVDHVALAAVRLPGVVQ